MLPLTSCEKILGGLWGSLVGDALGVPVEFKHRAAVQANPVKDMRGHGTHDQPPGTWSDDSSLLLCSAESLIEHQFDPQDMGARFLRWYRDGHWAAHGEVFDVGVTTSDAISLIRQGVRAEVAGSDSQFTNGNGSLMRILPVSLRFASAKTKELLTHTHTASAITHRHARSQMACGFFSLLIRQILQGATPLQAYRTTVSEFRAFYETDPSWSLEFDYFPLLLAGDLANRSESEIDSSGYVLHTLTASLWCLLTTSTFEACVLKAVNLGGDTDTTACVAGGLAGAYYGLNDIPKNWIQTLARHNEVATLFDNFSDLIHVSK